MERGKIICLLLFVGLILVFSACHPRHVSNIKPAMTKEEVISSWGRTNLITYKTTNGTTHETWEYHFSNTDSVCWVTFSQDRVVSTECRAAPRPRYYAYPYYPYPYPYPYYYPYYYPYRYWQQMGFISIRSVYGSWMFRRTPLFPCIDFHMSNEYI